MVYLLGFKDKSHECLLHSSPLSTIVLYADGFSRNLHRTPARIQSLLIRSVSLSPVDEFLLHGLNIITKLSMMTRKMRFMVFQHDVDAITPRMNKPVFNLKRFITSSTFASNAFKTACSEYSGDSEYLNMSSVSSKTARSRPSWLIVSARDRVEFKSSWYRCLSMEFLLDACYGITQFIDQTIDFVSIAIYLEEAIFSRHAPNKLLYWHAIHNVSAAIAGKRRIGLLAYDIAKGVYDSPDAVVTLPLKFLYVSFLAGDKGL